MFKDLIKSVKTEFVLPSVEVRIPTVRDHLDAIQLAKKEFPEGHDYEQLVFCKLLYCCKFNGEVWNIEKLKTLPQSFIMAIAEQMTELMKEYEKN